MSSSAFEGGQGGTQGGPQSGQGGDWGSRMDRVDGEGQRAFAVSAAPPGGQAALNQPAGSQGTGSPQFASSYGVGGPSGGLRGGQGGGQGDRPAGSAPGANGAGGAILGTLVIRPLPGEEGGQTREIVLDGRDVAIGRSPACDVVLEGDQLVSRRHALLRAAGDQYTIVDLGSSNGTYVNETEIHQNTPLNDGDLITIGEHELVYSTRQATAAAPSAVASGSLAPAREQQAPVSSATPPYAALGSVAAADLFDVSAAQTLLEPHSAPNAPQAGQMEPGNQPAWSQSAPAQAFPATAQPTPSSLGGLSGQSSYPAPYRPEESLAQPPAQQPAQGLYQPSSQPVQPPAPQSGQQAQPAAQAQRPSQYQQSYPQPYQQPQTSQTAAPAIPSYEPAVRSGTTGSVRTTTAYLRAVRTQLDEANQRLAQAEEEESRRDEQRRSELSEVRDRLNAILAEQRQTGYDSAGYAGSAYARPAASQANPNLAGLVTLARQTEQNPRQIDFMMQLASRAGEIATALESAQSRPAAAGGTPQALLAQLEALRARLDELLG
jgi:hypothetical protein